MELKGEGDDPELAQDLAREFYPLIGRVIVGWGKIERQIDLLFFSARSLDGPNRPEGKAPMSFTRKNAALRKFCATYPPLKLNKKFVEETLSEADTLASRRNLIAHGYFHGFFKGPPAAMNFSSRRYVPGAVERKEFGATVSDLEMFLRRMAKLEVSLLFLTLKFAEQHGKARMAALSNPPATATSLPNKE